MNHVPTDPNYKPIQFSEKEIRERYHRKAQFEEAQRRELDSIKKPLLRSPAEMARTYKALRHEAILAEMP